MVESATKGSYNPKTESPRKITRKSSMERQGWAVCRWSCFVALGAGYSTVLYFVALSQRSIHTLAKIKQGH